MKLCKIGIHKYKRIKKLDTQLDFYWKEITLHCSKCGKRKKREILEV